MTRCDEGTVVSVRDGALIDADDRLHIESCPQCTEELREAELRAERIAAELALDPIVVDTEAAKAAVRARLDALRGAEKPRRHIRRPLGQAAAFVLLGTAAAAALPSSPVRSWIDSRIQPPVAVETTTAAEVGPATIEVPVGDEGLTVSLRGVPEGEQIEVVWTEEATAEISAADGSSYAIAEGRAEAVVTGGPIRLTLPSLAGPIRVEVNGRRVLPRRAEEIELPEGSIEESTSRLLLAVPQH